MALEAYWKDRKKASLRRFRRVKNNAALGHSLQGFFKSAVFFLRIDVGFKVGDTQNLPNDLVGIRPGISLDRPRANPHHFQQCNFLSRMSRKGLPKPRAIFAEAREAFQPKGEGLLPN
jgi:hypothetical protein